MVPGISTSLMLGSLNIFEPMAINDKLKTVDKMLTFKLFSQSKLDANWHNNAPAHNIMKNGTRS